MESPKLSRLWRTLLGPRGRAVGLGLLVAVVVAVSSILPFGQALENQTLDLYYRLRPSIPPPVDLLVVAIDEPSFQELKQPWPWPRRLHAKLVERLAAAGARLIVFDIIFADATNPEDDELLAQAFKEAGNVVLGATFEVTKDPRFTRRILVTPQKSLQRSAKRVGLTMITPDPDGVVRRFRLSLAGEKTLPWVVAQLLRPDTHLSPTSPASSTMRARPAASTPSPFPRWLTLSDNSPSPVSGAVSSWWAACWRPRPLPRPRRTPFTPPSSGEGVNS